MCCWQRIMSWKSVTLDWQKTSPNTTSITRRLTYDHKLWLFIYRVGQKWGHCVGLHIFTVPQLICINFGTLQRHFIGRPFVKRFALCCQTVVCLSVLSCLWRSCTVAKRLDRSRWNLACGRPWPWPHCVRWGPSSPSPKGAKPPNFWPISVAAKWLHRSKCHLIWR